MGKPTDEVGQGNERGLPFDTDAMVVNGDKRAQVQLRDISLKGVRFEYVDQPDLEKGDQVRILLQLGDVGEEDPVTDLIAEVKHVDEQDGITARWREMSGQNFTLLSRQLDTLYEDPERLIREMN